MLIGSLISRIRVVRCGSDYGCDALIGRSALPQPERYKHLGRILVEAACVLAVLGVLAVVGAYTAQQHSRQMRDAMGAHDRNQ